VDIKINGVRPDHATVYAYKKESYGRGENLGYGYVTWDTSLATTGTWKIGILPSSSPRNVIFDVHTNNNNGSFNKTWDSGVSVTVSNANYPNIPITINKETLTLSGTATATVNGSSFGGGIDEHIQVLLYDGDGSMSNQIGYGSVNSSDGTWSMVIEKPAVPATYYLGLQAWITNSNGYTKWNIQSVPVSNSDVSGISLSHNFTVLSGTVNLTVNGFSLPAGTSVNVYLSSSSDPYNSGVQIGSAYLNAGETSWSMALNETPVSGTYYFRVNAWNSGGGGTNYNGVVGSPISFPLDSSYTGISLSHDFTVLSGTVYLTANGNPLPAGMSMSVSLSSSPDGGGQEIGYTNVYTGTAWSMTLNETPSPGTLYYFRVSTWSSGGGGTTQYWAPNVGQISFPTSYYSGITLTHNFIVLSGTAAITVNGSTPSGGTEVQIYLSSIPNDANGEHIIGGTSPDSAGNWSMALNETPSSGTYYFLACIFSTTGQLIHLNPNVGTITFPTGSYGGFTITHNFSQ
jgi:hypothetical protein